MGSLVLTVCYEQDVKDKLDPLVLLNRVTTLCMSRNFGVCAAVVEQMGVVTIVPERKRKSVTEGSGLSVIGAESECSIRQLLVCLGFFFFSVPPPPPL